METSVARAICSIYDAFFRQQLTIASTYVEAGRMFYRADAVVFALRCEVTTTPDQTPRQRNSTCIHIMLAGSSNVSVWVYVGAVPSPWDVPEDAWENPSNHDSCWCGDGVDATLYAAYSNLCTDVQAHLPIMEQVPFPQIPCSCEMDDVGRPFQLVRVEFVVEEDGRRRITKFGPSPNRIGIVSPEKNPQE